MSLNFGIPQSLPADLPFILLSVMKPLQAGYHYVQKRDRELIPDDALVLYETRRCVYFWVKDDDVESSDSSQECDSESGYTDSPEEESSYSSGDGLDDFSAAASEFMPALQSYSISASDYSSDYTESDDY